MAALSLGAHPADPSRPAVARAGIDSRVAPRLSAPSRVLGLDFANALGLAAGIDRAGAKLQALAESGVGHVEVGTLTSAADLALDPAGVPAGLVVGVSFASPRAGLDADAIQDYSGLLRAFWSRADYLVANLSSPHGGRDGETPGVEQLIYRLAAVRERLTDESGYTVPLLVKVQGGQDGSRLSRAVVAVRRAELDGVILSSQSLRRLEAVRQYLEDAIVISVGGIATLEEAVLRLAAGAKLVQIHRAFQDGGVGGVRRLLGISEDENR